MADAAVDAARTGYEVYFITVDPVRAFRSSGGRESMVSLLLPNRGLVHLITQRVGYEFEFGTDEYRANIYSALIENGVPLQTPVIVSDDKAVWLGSANIADKYPMVGVLHCDDPYYYEIGRKYSRQMSICVCVSERVRRTFKAQCPDFESVRLFAIPCGIHLPVFAPKSGNDGITRLTFIGRFRDTQKRAYDLVNIAAALHAQGYPFHLHIAGNDESSKVEFMASLKQQGVAHLVTFHGWLSASGVAELLSNTDVLLLTSNFEGTPLVMMEALAAGSGFAGTRVSGIEDYEHHQLAADCFSVFGVGDIEDAVTKIKAVAGIPAGSRQDAARKLAEQEFTMQVCLGRYFSALQAITPTKSIPYGPPATVMQKLYSRLIAVARATKVAMKK